MIRKHFTGIMKAALAFILIISTETIFAQSKDASPFSLYVHGLFGFSLEKSSQRAYKSQFGAVAGLGYNLNNRNTMLVGSFGYSAFPAKDKDVYGGNLAYIPLKAGVRQSWPLQNNKIFVQGDAGVAFLSTSATEFIPSSSDTRFAFDLGVGTTIKNGFEAALVWDNYKETAKLGWSSWLTLRVGYKMDF